MADDNLVQAAIGALEGFANVYLPYQQQKLKSDMENELLLKQDALTRKREKEKQQEQYVYDISKAGELSKLKRGEEEAKSKLNRAEEGEKFRMEHPTVSDVYKEGAARPEEFTDDLGRLSIKEATDIAKIREYKRKAKAAEDVKNRVGVPAAQAGMLTLAQESLKNISDVKSILFPDGTPESFDRGTAFKSNMPGISLPLIGRVTPYSMPFSEKGQNVFRKTGAAMSGRQLIQTGVAARPEETERLANQFGASVTSNPKSALMALNELLDFYSNYIKNVSTKGRGTLEGDTSEIDGGVEQVEDKDPLGLGF